ncbi:iron-siderophore ABC transporter substrate-binding protein [Paenibacillus sp. WST5]|uniref:Iron-siderophore ABC transporter substrate-binding protein n=2 Tax=Paenibacillus sedimenti TaxID=2770274 RepID=A0A926KVA9_9BACL|nr:iron-siderophore ABC transporter substrate-binding protein [Paenibacillus sedimenti]
MKTSKAGTVMLALTLSLSGLLSACTTTGKNVQQGAESKPANATATQTASVPKEISLKHAMGEAKLTGIPQRVVVLDNGALDNLLALGVKPIGAPTVQLDQPYPKYLKNQTEGIVNIGTVDEPNLESIAKQKPDLILGSKDTHEKIYEKLKQLAPTVYVETLGFTWKENLKLQAQAVGKEAEAAKLLKSYDDRMKDFRTQMGDRLSNTNVSILRPRADHVRIYLKSSFSGIIVDDAGLKRPATQQGAGLSVNATEEQVANMAGDAIIWFSRDKEHLLKTKLVNNPLWQKLDAVKANRVYEADPETWLSGLGYQAANLVVDDLFKFIVPAK